MKLLLSLALFLSTPVFGADTLSGVAREQLGDKGLRRQATMILLGGLAGGAVGLSTLSFYGRPQDRLSYIPVGIALGLIGGTIYSTYQMINNPREMRTDLGEPPSRAVWTVGNEVSPPLLQWKMDF